jgi:hypothetical protein
MTQRRGAGERTLSISANLMGKTVVKTFETFIDVNIAFQDFFLKWNEVSIQKCWRAIKMFGC